MSGLGQLALSAGRLYVEAFCDVGTLVLVRAATGGWSIALDVPDLVSLYGLADDGTGAVWVLAVNRITAETTVYTGTSLLQPFANYVPAGRPYDFWGIAADTDQVYVVGSVNGTNRPLAASVTSTGFRFEEVTQPSGPQPLWEVTIDDAGTVWAVGGPGNQSGPTHPSLHRRSP